MGFILDAVLSLTMISFAPNMKNIPLSNQSESIYDLRTKSKDEENID